MRTRAWSRPISLLVSCCALLTVQGAQAQTGQRKLIKVDGNQIDTSSFGSGSQTVIIAPGNEQLAARDAAQGEFPALAAAQVKASDATPKSEWSTGNKALMLTKSRPDTRLVGLSGCGHNMINERRNDIGQLMAEFIAGHRR